MEERGGGGAGGPRRSDIFSHFKLMYRHFLLDFPSESNSFKQLALKRHARKLAMQACCPRLGS